MDEFKQTELTDYERGAEAMTYFTTVGTGSSGYDKLKEKDFWSI